ncbi:MAG: MnhB domain-containing protein [Candidatus Omnitrophota bacterium]|jgi:multicomponent Na+:H+ antiporter subunit B|nr:MnhB domain-containing protein [Candidatus Omnitrophota bacterium]
MEKNNKGMTLIVKTITRLTVGLIILFGIYIVAHGHLTPGGGFAGGVIIALSFIHIMLAFGKEVAIKKVSKKVAKFFESIGAIIFISLAITGIISGYYFLNFLYKGEPYTLFSAGLVPLYNFAICFKVAAGLFLIFGVMVFFKIHREGE